MQENRHWGTRICRSQERGCRGGMEGRSEKNLLKAAVCTLSAHVLTHPLRLPSPPLHWSCLVNNFLVAGFQSDFLIPTLGYLFPAQRAAPGPEVWTAPPAISLFPPLPTVPQGRSHCPAPLMVLPSQAHVKGLCPTVVPTLQALSDITALVYFFWRTLQTPSRPLICISITVSDR